MNIEKQDLAECQMQLTVEVPQERVQGAMRSAARRLSDRTRIPGFRPGKAPYELVVRKVGEEAVFDEALDHLGQDIYREALQQSEVEAYAPGALEELVTREPLVLRYVIPLEPEVELGDYASLRLPFEAGAVPDEALESFLEELRQRRALMEPVSRPATLGDVVDLKLRATLPATDDAPASTLLDEQEVPLLLADETDWPFKGVAARLEGLTADEERTLQYTFPEDYPNESLRSRQAEFHVRCLQVRSRTVPEWTDDLARSLGEFNDLLDLRVKARESLQEQAHQAAEREYAQRVVEQVVDQANVKFPPVLLREEQDSMLSELERRLRSQNLSLEDYLRIEHKSLDELRAEIAPDAGRRVRRALVIGRVIRQEGLTLSDEEIHKHIDQVVSSFEDPAGKLRQAFESPSGHQRIATDLLYDRAVERLVAIAKGEAPQSEPSAAAPAQAERASQE
ncbi:MAG: trigger factor [Anaerolineales bacterium]|nr:trigger factor [Anaerolineales bacterium]